jgi:hypothetical protein
MTAQFGSSASYSFTYAGISPALNMQMWNGDNVTSQRQLELGYGQVTGAWNAVLKTTVQGSPITSYTVSATNHVVVDQELVSYNTALKNLNPKNTPLEDAEQLYGFLPTAWTIFWGLVYWLKFLFVDNLIMTVILYLTGTMAYAANTSRNIFAFYKTWFRQQIALFNFISNAFSTTISIVAQIVTAAGGIIGSLLTRIGL